MGRSASATGVNTRASAEPELRPRAAPYADSWVNYADSWVNYADSWVKSAVSAASRNSRQRRSLTWYQDSVARLIALG